MTKKSDFSEDWSLFGANPDIWRSISDDERKRRARRALVDSLEKHLRDNPDNMTKREYAESIIDSIPQEDFKEYRITALKSDSNLDYTDRIALTILETEVNSNSDI